MHYITFLSNFVYYRPQRSWGKVMFSHVSVILFMGGVVVVSQHALQVVSQHALQQVSGSGIPACLAGFQAHIQGGKLRGSGQGGFPGPHPRGKLRGIWPGGVSRPTPGGGLSQHVLRQTPRRLLLRAVRILLECILVSVLVHRLNKCSHTYPCLVV